MTDKKLLTAIKAIRAQLDNIETGKCKVALTSLEAAKKILAAPRAKAGRKAGSIGRVRLEDIAVLVWRDTSLDNEPIEKIIREAIGTGLLEKTKSDRAHKNRINRAASKLGHKK